MVSVYFQKDLTGKLKFLDEKYLVNKSLPTWNRDNLIKILSIILSHFGQGVADEKAQRNNPMICCGFLWFRFPTFHTKKSAINSGLFWTDLSSATIFLELKYLFSTSLWRNGGIVC